MEDFKNILVVSQSTKDCRRALGYGISLTKCFHARLYVLHLIHDPFGLDHWQLPLPSLRSIRKEHRDILVKAQKDLDAILAAEQGRGLPIQVHIAEGPPDKEIRRAVKDHKIDLLIMIAHAEGYWEQRLFDRLSEEIHRDLPCTIMFVKKEPAPVKQAFCLRRDRVESCEAY